VAKSVVTVAVKASSKTPSSSRSQAYSSVSPSRSADAEASRVTASSSATDLALADRAAIGATRNVAVTPVNDAPVAAADGNSASGDEDTVITGALPAGSDLERDALTYEPVGTVAGLTLNPDGTFSYAPAENFNSVVIFDDEVVDPSGLRSAPQTFTLTVNGAVRERPARRTLPPDIQLRAEIAPRPLVGLDHAPLRVQQHGPAPDGFQDDDDAFLRNNARRHPP
jgi:hypothetical protein